MQGLEYYNIFKFWCISNEKHIKETSMEHIDEVICERIIGCNIDTVSVTSQCYVYKFIKPIFWWFLYIHRHMVSIKDISFTC